MQIDIEFIAEQFQQYADLDPVHAFEVEGCIRFGDTPVFYQRHADHFVLEVAGAEYEVPRFV